MHIPKSIESLILIINTPGASSSASGLSVIDFQVFDPGMRPYEQIDNDKTGCISTTVANKWQTTTTTTMTKEETSETRLTKIVIFGLLDLYTTSSNESIKLLTTPTSTFHRIVLTKVMLITVKSIQAPILCECMNELMRVMCELMTRRTSSSSARHAALRQGG
jgi:hypothetical protein